MPQWDFLKVIAEASRQEPSYELIMEAEITDLLWDEPRVIGLTYRKDGRTTAWTLILLSAVTGDHPWYASGLG